MESVNVVIDEFVLEGLTNDNMETELNNCTKVSSTGTTDDATTNKTTSEVEDRSSEHIFNLNGHIVSRQV